jgi:hypothetical protein
MYVRDLAGTHRTKNLPSRATWPHNPNKRMNTSNQISFREAVVLNNIAASMLEYGAFSQAAETLKDSVSLIRSSVNARSSSSPELKLHNARLRLSESLNQRKARRISPCVEVLFNDASMFASSIDHATISPSLIAIKIDNYDRADRDPDAISAILFYNFGLSYYCLSKSLSQRSKLAQSKEASTYFKGSLRLFRISHSLCAKVLQSKMGIECPELLNVMAIVLGALTKFLFEANQVDQAKAFCSMLNQVRHVLKEAKLRLGLSEGASAAAAA